MKRIFVSVASVVVLLLAALPVFAGGSAEKATANSGPVTLHLLVYGAATADAFDALAKEYKTETGDTLDITLLTNDQQTVLRARLNSGNAPDIFMTSAYADDNGYKDYSYNLTNEDFIKKIQPATLSGVTLNGQITGFPFIEQSYSFIYNKKLFAQAGITALPKTLSDYDAVAQKLQAAGIQPFATGFHDWWVLPQTSWPIIAPTIETKYGGYAKFTDQLNSGALKFKDIPEMSAIFDMLDLIKKYGGPRPSESDFNDQVAKMGAGQVAIIHQGDWAVPSIEKIDPNISLGYLLEPVAAGADKDGIMLDSNITLRVAKDNPNLQHSLAFLKWLTSSDYAQTWFPKIADDMSTVVGMPGPPNQLDQEAAKLVAAGTPTYPWYYQRFPTGLEQGLGVVLQAYTAGQTNRQQTIDALDSTYTKIANANK